MTGAGPSLRVLQRQIQSCLEKRPDLALLAIRVPVPWEGEQRVVVGTRPCRLVWCPSALALRERLVAPRPAEELLVLLTDRREQELGGDVLARLPRARLLAFDAWEALLDAFAARSADPRLAEAPWLPEALLEAMPTGGFPPAPAGFLTWEAAWSALLAHRFGVLGAPPDLSALLARTLEPDGWAAFASAPEEVQTGVVRFLQAVAGPAGAGVARLALAGRGGDAVPLGLALRVVFSEPGRPEPELREAAVRLEPRLGGEGLPPEAGRLWAAAAEAEARRLLEESPARGQALLARGDELLDELKVARWADLSSLLPGGLEARLRRFAESLARCLGRRPALADAGVEEAARGVLEHERLSMGRAEAIDMARRLLRWLARAEAVAAGEAPGGPALAGLARAYAEDSAFADWARSAAREEVGGALAPALEALLARASAARERENERFGLALAEAARTGGAGEGLIPVERILAEVVAPLAAEGPVLFVVVDGLSLAVFHALLPSVLARGWLELVPEAAAGSPSPRRLGLAALPSVTRYCRTSLLAGRLAAGGQSGETAAFAAQPDLVAVSSSSFPPVLFHKDSLRTEHGAGPSEELRSEIERRARRVVGVVVNAVDDFLAKSEQLSPRWETEAIPVLGALLEAAEVFGRAVVVVADHGHVLEWGCEPRPGGEGGERFRAGDGRPGAGELEIAGRRVLEGGGRIVAPWSERLRYGQRKNGYHGGISPQEMLVPIAVLGFGEPALAGFRPAARGTVPAWWEEGAEPAAREVTSPRRRRAAARPGAAERPAPQIELFSEPRSEEARPIAGWIDDLLACDLYRQQRTLAGPARLADERVREVLALLDQHGGRLTRAALGRALNLPPLRLAGYLAALERLLNVEGYRVIAAAPGAGETVALDRRLLAVQFEIEIRP